MTSVLVVLPFKVLVNVGPAKPKHKLPECERKALLSDASLEIDAAGANQSHETPQIEPYMETSFNTTDPVSHVSLRQLRTSVGREACLTPCALCQGRCMQGPRHRVTSSLCAPCRRPSTGAHL